MKLVKFIEKTLATFFYVGYFPLIPGTAASIAGVFLFYLIKGDPRLTALLIIIVLFLGFLTCGRAEKAFGKKDDRRIVIDEIAGMLLALLFIPLDIKLVIIAFILFRIFDALKVYPAGSLQNLKGSLGIIIDDIIAGLYANFVLQAVLRLAIFRVS